MLLCNVMLLNKLMDLIRYQKKWSYSCCIVMMGDKLGEIRIGSSVFWCVNSWRGLVL